MRASGSRKIRHGSGLVGQAGAEGLREARVAVGAAVQAGDATQLTEPRVMSPLLVAVLLGPRRTLGPRDKLLAEEVRADGAVPAALELRDGDRSIGEEKRVDHVEVKARLVPRSEESGRVSSGRTDSGCSGGSGGQCRRDESSGRLRRAEA